MRGKACRISFVACLLIAFRATSPVVGQASDLFDTERLGERGVVFEAPLDPLDDSTAAHVRDGVGVGDFNGDGFADIALSVTEAGEEEMS